MPDYSMLDLILKFDTNTFYFINSSLKNVVFDTIMPYITDINNFHGFLAVLAIILLFGGGKGRITLLFVLLAVIVGEVINSHILKEFFHRYRPCTIFHDINLLMDCPKNFSFPSSHAMYIATACTVLGIQYRWATIPLAIIVFLVCFSRIYIGVHYPLDTIAGITIGYVWALCLVFVGNRLIGQVSSLKYQ